MLTGLEQKSLKLESKNLNQEHEHLRNLLASREDLLNALVQELHQLKKRFATSRQTRLVKGGDALVAERLASQKLGAGIQRQRSLATLSHDGYLLIQRDGQVKIVSSQLRRQLHLNEPSAFVRARPPIQVVLLIDPPTRILAVTETGRAALVRWELAGQQPGSLKRFLPNTLEEEKIATIIPLPINSAVDWNLGLLSSDGRFKGLPIAAI